VCERPGEGERGEERGLAVCQACGGCRRERPVRVPWVRVPVIILFTRGRGAQAFDSLFAEGPAMSNAIPRGGGYAAAAAAAGGPGSMSANSSPMVMKLEPAVAHAFAVLSPGATTLGKRSFEATTRSASPYTEAVDLQCEGTDCFVRLHAPRGCAQRRAQFARRRAQGYAVELQLRHFDLFADCGQATVAQS
jgi:hypothetical protein